MLVNRRKVDFPIEDKSNCTQIVKNEVISPNSCISQVDTIISPAMTVGSVIPSSSPSIRSREDRDQTLPTLSTISSLITKSPSTNSNYSSDSNRTNPPYPESYEAVLQFMYTNERSTFYRHLKENFDNVFCSLGNLRFLGSGNENDFYEAIVSWILDHKKLTQLFGNKNWKDGKVTISFIRKLIEEYKKRLSFASKSLSRRPDTSFLVSEEELLNGILRWTRPEGSKKRNWKQDERQAFAEVLSLIDFQQIPKEKVLNILENKSIVSHENTAFFLTQETLTELIRVAWLQYEAPVKARKSKWFTTLVKFFNK